MRKFYLSSMRSSLPYLEPDASMATLFDLIMPRGSLHLRHADKVPSMHQEGVALGRGPPGFGKPPRIIPSTTTPTPSSASSTCSSSVHCSHLSKSMDTIEYQIQGIRKRWSSEWSKRWYGDRSEWSLQLRTQSRFAQDPKMTSYLTHGVKAKMCETTPFVNTVGSHYVASRAQIEQACDSLRQQGSSKVSTIGLSKVDVCASTTRTESPSCTMVEALLVPKTAIWSTMVMHTAYSTLTFCRRSTHTTKCCCHANLIVQVVTNGALYSHRYMQMSKTSSQT